MSCQVVHFCIGLLEFVHQLRYLVNNRPLAIHLILQTAQLSIHLLLHRLQTLSPRSHVDLFIGLCMLVRNGFDLRFHAFKSFINNGPLTGYLIL